MTELTKREFEVYMLVAEWAFDIKSISKSLGISKRTVNRDMKSIYDKMGLSSPLELLVQYHTRERCQ